MVGALLRQRFLDALTILSGVSVLGGVMGWAYAMLRSLLLRKKVAFERAAVNGAGFGGLVGLAVAALDLVW